MDIAKSNQYKGYALGILSSASFGLIPLFSLPVLGSGMPHETLVFWRFVFSALLLGGYRFSMGARVGLGLRYLPSMLVLGILYILSAVLLFRGYGLMPSGIATVLHYMYPFFVSLSLWLVWRERISLLSALAMALAIVGVALLMGLGQTDGTAMPINPMAMFIVLSSGMAYALYIVMLKHSPARELTSGQLSLWMFIIAGLGCGLHALWVHGEIALPAMAFDWLHIVGLALIPTVVSNVCLVLAVQQIGALPTAILGAMEPLTAVALGVLWFGEELSPLGLAGILVIISAVLLSIASSPIEQWVVRWLGKRAIKPRR